MKDYSGILILSPKKSAFKNKRLVPYHDPLKFGLSAKRTTLPPPNLLTTKEAEGFRFSSKFFLVIKPSIKGLVEYFATVAYSFLLGANHTVLFLYTGIDVS